jgi:hypothetical protein
LLVSFENKPARRQYARVAPSDEFRVVVNEETYKRP